MSKFIKALERLKIIADAMDDNDPDKQEMLNVEGDYTDLMEWALQKRADVIAQADACKALADRYKDRADRLKNRGESLKDVIEAIMSAADEVKYTGTATVSVRTIPPKPIVQNEDLVPDEYKKTTVSIDKTAINQAIKEGKSIEGVVMDNGGQSLTIRMK